MQVFLRINIHVYICGNLKIIYTFHHVLLSNKVTYIILYQQVYEIVIRIVGR